MDDHQIIRESLRLFLETEPDLSVCGEASHASEALLLIDRLKPDAVICDISLPGANGIQFLKELKNRCPRVRAVVLTMHDELSYVERALSAGARGYVLKRESADLLVTALRHAFADQVYVTPALEGTVFHPSLPTRGPGKSVSRSPMALLSDRELEVFELIGRGLGMREIAAALFLSPKTVESHRSHVKEKLDLKSTAEVLTHAIRWIEHASQGLLPVPVVAS